MLEKKLHTTKILLLVTPIVRFRYSLRLKSEEKIAEKVVFFEDVQSFEKDCPIADTGE